MIEMTTGECSSQLIFSLSVPVSFWSEEKGRPGLCTRPTKERIVNWGSSIDVKTSCFHSVHSFCWGKPSVHGPFTGFGYGICEMQALPLYLSRWETNGYKVMIWGIMMGELSIPEVMYLSECSFIPLVLYIYLTNWVDSLGQEMWLNF